jgi:hypothetical protein
MKLPVAAIAALALMAGTAARAEIVRIVYTGYVEADSSPDNLGLFGTPGASLANDPYTAVYTINDAYGTSVTNGSTVSFIVGTGEPSPTTEVLTIDGRSFDVAPGPSGGDQIERAFDAPGPVFGLAGPIYGLSAIISGPGELQSANGIFSDNPFTASYDYHQPVSYVTQSTDVSRGGFQDCSGSGITCDGLVLYSATVQVTDPVPEPAAWALMLAGFGAVGAALRTRARRQAA